MYKEPEKTNTYRNQQPKTATALSQLLGEFPRQHLVAVGMVVTVVTAALLFTPTQEVQANRTDQLLALPVQSELAVEQPLTELVEAVVQDDSLAPIFPAVTAEVMKSEAVDTISAIDVAGIEEEVTVDDGEQSEALSVSQWVEVDVQSGDSLAKIFQRAALTERDLHQLMASTSSAKDLSKIHPGQQFAFQIDDNGQLQALEHRQNRLKTTLYERVTDEGSERYTANVVELEPESHQHYSLVVIDSSLYNAGNKAGLSQGLIMALTEIYGGVIDFVYDVRRGDSFNVLYEEYYVDGEKYANGPILAAEFTNQGKTYRAYRYQNENGDIAYYDESGESMQKTFLRAPLEFKRISSHFNPNRLHPIHKTVRPHNGIDYAAPTGTPVYAAGDGRVVTSGYTKANGHYVVIQHNDKYTTKYLHLHKRGVKQGERVKQQQIIGWVGSSGYATGPHLHYEFLVNGVHKNPRTVELPKGNSLAEAEKQRFFAYISPVQTQLASYNQGTATTTVAAAEAQPASQVDG